MDVAEYNRLVKASRTRSTEARQFLTALAEMLNTAMHRPHDPTKLLRATEKSLRRVAEQQDAGNFELVQNAKA
jgi:hypothetical protein